MNLEDFKSRLKTDRLAQAISSKLDDDYETSIDLTSHEENSESCVTVTVHVELSEGARESLSTKSTDHHFDVHMIDDCVSAVNVRMSADHLHIERLRLIYDALILRLYLDFDGLLEGAIEIVKQKIIALTELGVEQIDDLIELSREIDLLFTEGRVCGTKTDVLIWQEVQEILRRAEEIKLLFKLSKTVDVETHRSLILAKIRLSRLMERKEN